MSNSDQGGMSKRMARMSKRMGTSEHQDEMSEHQDEMSRRNQDAMFKDQGEMSKDQVGTSEHQDEMSEDQVGTSEHQDEMSKPQDKMSKPQDKMSKHQEGLFKDQHEVSKDQDEMSKYQDEMSKPQDKMSKPQDKMSKHQEGLFKDQHEVSKDQDEMSKDQGEIFKAKDEIAKDQYEMSKYQETLPIKVKEEMSTKDKTSTTGKDEAPTKDKQKTSTKDKQKTSTRCKSSKTLKGRVIHSKERGIIRNVLRYFDREASIRALLYPVKQAQQRAAAATGVSLRTIVRIRNEALANPPQSRLKTPGRHRRRRKATQEGEDSSKRKQPDASTDEDEESGADLSTGSSGPLNEPKETPLVNPKCPTTEEYVFKEEIMVDVNFFVRCLRKANSHHGTLPCNLNDMFMYEEASKIGILGIIFRCRVCLMDIIVWTQDPNAKLDTVQPQATGHTNNVSQRKRKSNSFPITIDLISPKMRNLPKFLNENQSIQSNPPLVGWPQVAPYQNSVLRRSGWSPPLEHVQPASIKATVAELTFCVDKPDSPPVPGSVSIESSEHSISSTTMPKSIDTSSQSSIKIRIPRLVHLGNKSTSKPASKKSITSNVVSQKHLKPKISQFSDTRPSPLQPIISEPFSVRASSLNPVTVESNSIVTSSFQPKLIQASGMMASSLQPRLIQTAATMDSTMHPRLNQSGNMTPTFQPRLIQANGMLPSTLPPRIFQSSGASTSPTGMANSSRMFLIQRPLRPQSHQSSGSGTLSATMVRPEQIIQTAQRPFQPRFVPSSSPGSSSTAMIKHEQIVRTPSAYAQRPPRPGIVQSSSLRKSPTGMLKPEGIIIGQDVFVQRPMMPRIVGPASDKIPIFNDVFPQRPLLPGSVQSNGPRPVRAIKSEEISVTPEHRILQSGNTPLITSSSTIVAPETIISDVAAKNDSRQSSTDTLPLDLSLVKMEVEKSDPCDTS